MLRFATCLCLHTMLVRVFLSKTVFLLLCPTFCDTCESHSVTLFYLLQEVRSASELADFMRYDLEDDEVAPIEDRVNDSMTTESRQKLKNYLKPIEKV